MLMASLNVCTNESFVIIELRAVRGEVGKECVSIAQTALDLNDVGEKVIKAIFCK